MYYKSNTVVGREKQNKTKLRTGILEIKPWKNQMSGAPPNLTVLCKQGIKHLVKKLDLKTFQAHTFSLLKGRKPCWTASSFDSLLPTLTLGSSIGWYFFNLCFFL
jgi:hypothetical protein